MTKSGPLTVLILHFFGLWLTNVKAAWKLFENFIALQLLCIVVMNLSLGRKINGWLLLILIISLFTLYLLYQSKSANLALSYNFPAQENSDNEAEAEIFRKYGGNCDFTNRYLDDQEKAELRHLFKSKSLWASRSNGENKTEAVPDVDVVPEPGPVDRFILQTIWKYLGPQVHPELFSSNTTKKIGLFNFGYWFEGTGEGLLNCPGLLDHRCEFLDSKNQNVDAILVNVDWAGVNVPEVESPTILRILQTWQSPLHSLQYTFERANDLLATYWRGADIIVPYAKWVNFDPKNLEKVPTRNFAQGKSKMAAIFVSNCKPHNNRLGYVHELAKFIPVDIYGKCGNKTCVKKREKECLKKLVQDYRFYLAFENSNCRDYVTEKFYVNGLLSNVIPVVLGAHPSDYKDIAPPHSYIHVEDFEGPEALAGYLKKLAADDDLYNSYFRWKDQGKFRDTEFFCQICSLIYYADLYFPQARTSRQKWAPLVDSSSPMCLPENQWYWTKTKTTGHSI